MSCWLETDYQKPAFVVAFWVFDNYYIIPRDPIILSKDDWGLQGSSTILRRWLDP